MQRRTWIQSISLFLAWCFGVLPADGEFVYVATYRSHGKSTLLGMFDTEEEASQAQLKHIFGPDKPTGTYHTHRLRVKRTGLCGITFRKA